MKVCSGCGVSKPREDFYYGHGNYCKLCKRLRVRELERALTPEERSLRNFKTRIWKFYRLRPEQYEELIKDGCAICGTHENLCIDHDHRCCPGGKTCGSCIRGVLCDRHNKGEGAFESIAEIESLLAYRMKFEEKEETNL